MIVFDLCFFELIFVSLFIVIFKVFVICLIVGFVINIFGEIFVIYLVVLYLKEFVIIKLLYVVIFRGG